MPKRKRKAKVTKFVKTGLYGDKLTGKTFILDEYDPPRGLAIVLRTCAECGNLIGTKLDGTAPKSCAEHN